MARIDVLMPSMGESLAEGTLTKWYKKVGDPVKRDETIFEISTDKVDSEVQAVSAGILAEILVQEGEMEVTIEGKSTRIGPGSVAYVHSNEMHGWRNVGTTRAQYFVIAIGRQKA